MSSKTRRIAVVIGTLLAWLIGNGIANPIKRMTEVMQRLAKGDKSVEILGTERGDEIVSATTLDALRLPVDEVFGRPQKDS